MPCLLRSMRSYFSCCNSRIRLAADRTGQAKASISAKLAGEVTAVTMTSHFQLEAFVSSTFLTGLAPVGGRQTDWPIRDAKSAVALFVAIYLCQTKRPFEGVVLEQILRALGWPLQTSNLPRGWLC